jgi:hypothetical protein
VFIGVLLEITSFFAEDSSLMGRDAVLLAE